MKTRINIEIIITLSICLITILTNAQKASVEKSTFGIQAGFLGFWAHREVKLSNEIALRAELGMDAGFFGGDFYPENGYILTPVITLEPRWYYNLDKRVSKLRNISGNSGNFLTVKTSYNPNWFVLSNYDNVQVFDQISIIPTWGIKRNIGKHFTYETGIGFGYKYIFSKSAGFSKNIGEADANLHLRIGYRF